MSTPTPTPTPFSPSSDPFWDDPWADGQWPDARSGAVQRASNPAHFDSSNWNSQAWSALAPVPSPPPSPPPTPPAKLDPSEYKAKDPQSNDQYAGNSTTAVADLNGYVTAITGVTIKPTDLGSTSSDVTQAIAAINGAASQATSTISGQQTSTDGSINSYQPPPS